MTTRAHAVRRAVVSDLPRKLGDAGAKPTYIFNERRVGCRIPVGEGASEEPPTTP